MISADDIQHAKEEYEESLVELGHVEYEKDKIIHEYIDELEEEKIKKIRESLGLSDRPEN